MRRTGLKPALEEGLGLRLKLEGLGSQCVAKIIEG